jgi:hypothetical protein
MLIMPGGVSDAREAMGNDNAVIKCTQSLHLPRPSPPDMEIVETSLPW